MERKLLFQHRNTLTNGVLTMIFVLGMFLSGIAPAAARNPEKAHVGDTLATSYRLMSPDGRLVMNFTLNADGRPFYDLSYKGHKVIKPSSLGLELRTEGQVAYAASATSEYKREKRDDSMANLMSGFTIADVKTSTFDETWQPVWVRHATSATITTNFSWL